MALGAFVARVHMDIYRRMRSGELLQSRDEQLAREKRLDRNAQRLAAVIAPEQRSGIVDAADELVRLLEQQPAGDGQFDRAARAIEELHLELLLQFLDLVTDG